MTIRELFGDCVGKAGTQSCRASDAQRALDLSEEEAPDLVVLIRRADTRLQVLGGFAVICGLKENPCHVDTCASWRSSRMDTEMALDAASRPQRRLLDSAA